MKQRKFSKWLVAILVVCLVSTFALAACTIDDDDTTEATYYLSVDGATYSSESNVPSGVKFTKSDDVYTLTAELEEGKVLTVNKVGSDDKIGYDSIFSDMGKLTKGANNAMVVAEKGTFTFTLDPTEPQITYAFTASGGGGGGGTAVTGVTLNKHELVLGPEGSEKLIATVAPATAINKTLLWTTSNGSVASVDQDGTVTAVSSGTAKITVTSQENGAFYDECNVTVRQGVTSINLSASSLTVYTGEGASARELEVTINPENATNQEYTVSVEQSDEFILFTKAGKTISITGKAIGTATLKVASADDPTITASCEITVKELSDAVPALSKDNSTIDIGGEDTVNILLDNGEITSFIVTSGATEVATVAKSESGNSFTVTGVAFGSATITVVVTYGESKTENLTLAVRVAPSQFFITGTFDGTSWTEPSKDENYLTSYDVVLSDKGDGTYEITRHFGAGEVVQVLSTTKGNDGYWSNALTSSTCGAVTSNTSHFAKSGNADVKIIYAGTYTVKVDLTGSKASWTILVVSVDFTSVSITGDSSIEKGSDPITLSLKVLPEVITVDASSVSWSVKEEGSRNLVALTPSGLTCKLALTDAFDNVSTSITVVVTITVDGEVAQTAQKIISLVGDNKVYVEYVEFDAPSGLTLYEADSSKVYLYKVTGGAGPWQFNLSAQAFGSDGSTPYDATVTYTIKEGNGTVYANDDVKWAFEIDSDSGLVTVRMFCTFTVVATSVGTTSGGETKSAEIVIRVYSDTFYASVNWSALTESTASTANEGYSVYTWTNVALSEKAPVLFLYEGIGDASWDSTIRSGNYLNKTATSQTSGVLDVNGSKTGSSAGCFTVAKSGLYTITIDISGAKPSVTFVWTDELPVSDSITIKVNIHDSNNYATPLVSQDVTFTSSDETRTLSMSLTYTSSSSWPNIEFSTVIGSSTTYYNGSYTGVTLNFGSTSWKTSGGCKCWYDGTVAANTTFTLVFTFDEYGAITAISFS